MLEDGAVETQTANYLTTGVWSEGAIAEARKYCSPNEVASNKPHKYQTIAQPDDWKVDPKAKYFHYCDNETVQGFEFHDFPFQKVPKGQILVCDMSSNLLTKEIDWNRYDLVYAGAQKNVGPAGVTIVIVRSTLVKGHRSDTPLICDWELFSKAQNMFHNTPACFPIYMCGLNLAYIIEQGGVPAMKAMAEKRSKLLYDCIDSSDGYYIN